ncbi:calcium:sodium exchange protein [Pedobacter lusitanus]|uniref:alpha-L-fucosidase n=1 Tax=Pedobacter lusitanus TaxID=1503925 RepID=A0A0D0FR28_9SPHI|nr:alpha-L-fucosidase [Pedobacter lusitanus]KIO74879.1 calcium:sodium exchange protein [Pedobacter lusitanus]
MKKIVLIILASILSGTLSAQEQALMPVASLKPGKYQLEQIKRKYGMFIHFSINTFNDVEWSDGSLPASSYQPTAIDAEQWVKTAKDAGMKYVILVTKHHDGFCLWDSKYTEYDVANSGNKTNVIEAVAKACNKYNIGLGIYYSLWDRHQNPDTKNAASDQAYNKFMLGQLNELIDIAQQNKTRIVEFWFDGGWEKQNSRWPVQDIYQAIKVREPQCQIGINWSIGAPGNSDQHLVLPEQQKEGYPIRYFPGDFRLGDPYLPASPDPKIFTHEGKQYYMPWESTVCISEKWFYNTKDTVFKSITQLVADYKRATAQDNILILNTPPGRDGKIRQKDIEILTAIKKRLQNDNQ